MTMTDRGSRVPLLVSWPGKIEPGSQCNDLVELADFLPTFLELASAPEPKQSIDGTSFLPQLLGKKGSPKRMGSYRICKEPADPKQGMDLYQ